jgi:hypothetical protein
MCGVDGCVYRTKDNSTLKKHHASVHGIGDTEKAEARRRYVAMDGSTDNYDAPGLPWDRAFHFVFNESPPLTPPLGAGT